MPQDVYSNNIEGTIPEEIGLMSNLTYVNFGKNALTGTIPQEFCNFPILETLNLSENNNLQGSLQCLCDTDTNDMLREMAVYAKYDTINCTCCSFEYFVEDYNKKYCVYDKC
mmetsp:Transcript_34062/g.34281  ORF Transcript_34062/g.34281 Transcript_34062/m.34281 type:complete len:112 (-) Transcript_34062:439-774(-)